MRPIVRKHPVPRKQQERRIAETLPLPRLTILPPEILDKILRSVLEGALLKSSNKKNLVIGLRQYHALLLTCKFFKAVIDSACVNVSIECLNLRKQYGIIQHETIIRALISSQNDFPATLPLNYIVERCSRIDAIKRWDVVFKLLQLLSVQHSPHLNLSTIGKFGFNPYVNLGNLLNLDLKILERLQPVFERTKRPATKKDRDRIPARSYISYSPNDIVSVIDDKNEHVKTYSVRTWKSKKIQLSSLSISARVTEWWILETRNHTSHYFPNIYIAGYYEKCSVIIDVHSWKISQTFEARRPSWR
jgi:hypothetical protein